MPEKAKDPDQPPVEPTVAPLEPIRIVRRSIECPDGTTVEVDVPVYPPFRFEVGDPDSPEEKAPGRAVAPASAKGSTSDAEPAGETSAEKIGKSVAKKTPRKGSKIVKPRSRTEKASG